MILVLLCLCYVGKTLFKQEQDRGLTWQEVEDRLSSRDGKDSQGIHLELSESSNCLT